MPIPSNQVSVIEVRMKGIASAQGSISKNFMFVFNFRRTATTAALSKTNIESAFQAGIAVPITAALNNTYTQSSTDVRFINDALDQALPISRAIAGAVAGDAMSKGVAAYLLFRTGLRGKSFKGSKHLAPLSENDTTAGTADILNASAITNFQAVATAIINGFTDANGNIWVPTVLARKLSQMKTNPTTVITNDVTQILLNKRIGRMKKRLPTSVY